MFQKLEDWIENLVVMNFEISFRLESYINVDCSLQVPT